MSNIGLIVLYELFQGISPAVRMRCRWGPQGPFRHIASGCAQTQYVVVVDGSDQVQDGPKMVVMPVSVVHFAES